MGLQLHNQGRFEMFFQINFYLTLNVQQVDLSLCLINESITNRSII